LKKRSKTVTPEEKGCWEKNVGCHLKVLKLWGKDIRRDEKLRKREQSKKVCKIRRLVFLPRIWGEKKDFQVKRTIFTGGRGQKTFGYNDINGVF